MGHASIQTTGDLYGHLFPDYVDDLAARLSAPPASNGPSGLLRGGTPLRGAAG